MKVPPKRKGNRAAGLGNAHLQAPLNESPSEKEGKCLDVPDIVERAYPLNESPSEKEGKFLAMGSRTGSPRCPLNESPSEKEGK